MRKAIWMALIGLLLWCGSVQAADVWDGTTIDDSWETSGDGTAEAPYKISSCAQLADFAAEVNGGSNFSGEHIVLVQDLDLDGNPWTPIDSDASSKKFAGTFDGQGHTITGMTIDNWAKDAGLFGYIGAIGTVRNVEMIGASVSGQNATAYYAGIIAGTNEGTIESCYVNGGRINKFYGGGGVAGTNQGVIKDCGSGASVDGNYCAGGIAGRNRGGAILNSYNHGPVTTTSGNAGGIAGINRVRPVNIKSDIKNCYNTGSVSGGGNIGGLVGSNSNGNIYYSYWRSGAGAERAIGISAGDGAYSGIALFADTGGQLTPGELIAIGGDGDTRPVNPYNDGDASTTTLAEALTQWVMDQAAPSPPLLYKGWVQDETGGYPVLGDYWDSPLGGQVTISGSAVYGQTLTADISGLTPAAAHRWLIWRWQRGDSATGSFEDITGLNASGYTLTSADVNKYIRLQIASGNGNYDAGNAFAVTAQVGRAMPAYILPTLSPVTYDPELTLAEVALPAGWAWDDETIVPTINATGYSASFTPADTHNYLPVSARISLTVTAQPPDPGTDPDPNDPNDPDDPDDPQDPDDPTDPDPNDPDDPDDPEPETPPAPPVGRSSSHGSTPAPVSTPGPNQVTITPDRADPALFLVEITDDKGRRLEQVEGGIIITLPAEDTAVAVLVHADGTEEVIKQAVVENGMLRARIPGSAVLSIKPHPVGFDDVHNHWAAEVISFTAARELMIGTGEGRFSPEMPLTGAMMVLVLYRLDGEIGVSAQTPETGDAGEDADWYKNAVDWAAEHDIVRGVGVDLLAPERPVSHEQLAVTLYAYYFRTLQTLGTQEMGDPAAEMVWAQGDFPDRAAAVDWCAAQGLLTQQPDGSLDLQGPVSRAETAMVIERFIRILLR
ncbi:MAG: S-layer homology domain-containing protein [Syntrophomonadaceae bacterium]|nr:S-layer homology domain-containing protein [Syntrophomonadaceae bacterium]